MLRISDRGNRMTKETECTASTGLFDKVRVLIEKVQGKW